MDIDPFIRAGLIQFGYFDDAPIRFNLNLLPSYPQLLEKTALELVQLAGRKQLERILCPVDCFGIGVLVGQRLHLPLVYAQETYISVTKDLVGAYDVGHPTCLILNVWTSTNSQRERKLIERGTAGGLDVVQALSVVNIGNSSDDLICHSLFDLQDITNTLVARDQLSISQKRAVDQWTDQPPPNTLPD